MASLEKYRSPPSKKVPRRPVTVWMVFWDFTNHALFHKEERAADFKRDLEARGFSVGIREYKVH